MMSVMGPSFPDMLFLFLLALVIFGPKKLPEIGRQVGKLLNELKRASNEFKTQIQTEMDNMEEQEHAQKMLAPAEPPPGAVATLSLKPQPVSDSEGRDSGEVIEPKPIDLKPIDPELTDPKPTDPEPIVIHPLESERSDDAEKPDPHSVELSPVELGPVDRGLTNDSDAGDNHHPDSAIKATNA